MCGDIEAHSNVDPTDHITSDFADRMRAIQLSPRFTAFDLCCASNTWKRTRIDNEPKEEATWAALRQLCTKILEPVANRFGTPHVTYGFASQGLMKQGITNITPAGDQHVSCELNRKGLPVCKRLGASADFRVPGVSSLDVARFVVETLSYDRVIYYGADRPFHVSIGPDQKGDVVVMYTASSGRLLPRLYRPASWLASTAAP